MINLQALRAIAASFVVVDHSLQMMIDRHVAAESKVHLGWFFGWVGVTTFFIISGLIMLRSSINKSGSAAGALEFARRRIIRVVPLYWAATLIYFLLKSTQRIHYRLIEVFQSLLFYPYTSDTPGHLAVMRPIVGQGWTLNYEMLFYLLFTVCLFFPRKLGTTLLIGFFPIAIVVGLAGRSLIPYLDPVTPWQFWSDPICIFFAAGVIIGLLERKFRHWYNVSIPLVSTSVLFAAGFVLFLALDVRFPLPIWYQAGFGLLAIGGVILCTSTAKDRFVKKYRYLELAGDASFSTYLFHPLALGMLGIVWNRIPSRLVNAEMFIIFAVLICNAAGILIYLSVEKPLLAVLRPKSRAQPMPPQAPVALERA